MSTEQNLYMGESDNLKPKEPLEPLQPSKREGVDKGFSSPASPDFSPEEGNEQVNIPDSKAPEVKVSSLEGETPLPGVKSGS